MPINYTHTSFLQSIAMDVDDAASVPDPPSFVSLSPFPPPVSPSPRRLSSCFAQPSRRPVCAPRQLARVSLQGRLVGAEEATSARAISRDNGPALSPEEAVAWELFAPIHRVLLVAVIAVATANSRRAKEIFRLKKAVETRDQVLLGMQEKLDDLCEQISYFKDQPEDAMQSYDCLFCSKHKNIPSNKDNLVVKPSNSDEVLKFKLLSTFGEEPEERRMSDLSDWAPSLASSIDCQWNSAALDQDIYNLKKECEEKDATIKELSNLIHSSHVVGSKRIGELEDIIRRKNLIINRLRKDILVLEQKVVNLTRSRRRSLPTISNERPLPAMSDNLLFYLDASTSSSSSDSDSSKANKHGVASAKIQKIPPSDQSSSREAKRMGQSRSVNHLAKPMISTQKSQTPSPLAEKSLNLMNNADADSRQQSATPSFSENPRTRRQALAKTKDAGTQKRWA